MPSARTVNPIIADINEASNNNFTVVPALKNPSRGFFLGRYIHRCDVETVVYMIEPWEKFLLHGLVILFFACLLHFTVGSNVLLNYFE